MCDGGGGRCWDVARLQQQESGERAKKGTDGWRALAVTDRGMVGWAWERRGELIERAWQEINASFS